MPEVHKILNEHDTIRKKITELDNLVDKNSPKKRIVQKFQELTDYWEKHERKETRILSQINKELHCEVISKMLGDHHKELKSHWKVLHLAVQPENKSFFRTAFNNDFKMFLEKFKKHTLIEDEFLDKCCRNRKKYKN